MTDAIAGAVHTLRLLADGTVAVTLHFQPQDRVAVMTMMGSPATPIACARLADGFEAVKDEPKASHRDLGPICREAIGLCSNQRFLEYICRPYLGTKLQPTEAGAKAFILNACMVESRKDLDIAEGARELFIEHVRKPFYAWLDKERKK